MLIDKTVLQGGEKRSQMCPVTQSVLFYQPTSVPLYLAEPFLSQVAVLYFHTCTLQCSGRLFNTWWPLPHHTISHLFGKLTFSHNYNCNVWIINSCRCLKLCLVCIFMSVTDPGVSRYTLRLFLLKRPKPKNKNPTRPLISNHSHIYS